MKLKRNSKKYAASIAQAQGRLTFVFKLFEVVNDGKLIRWNENGDGVIVEQEEYEQHVCQLYPGFVQTHTFHNLRRLFRDYRFSQRILIRGKKKLGQRDMKIEYFHPQFRKNDYDSIILMKPKIRSYVYKTKRSSFSQQMYRIPRKYTRRFPTRSLLNNSDLAPSDPDFCVVDIASTRLNCGNLDLKTSQNAFVSQRHMTISESSKAAKPQRLSSEDMLPLFHILSQNELPDEQYVELALRRYGERFRSLVDGPADELIQAINDFIISNDELSTGSCVDVLFEEL